MFDRFPKNIGIIILLIVIYAILAWRTKPTEKAIEESQNQLPAVQNVSNDILTGTFVNQLRARDINGELPVNIDQTQTNAGEQKSPFGLP